jgi:hypothetical protein
MPPPDEYTCELCQQKFSQAQMTAVCVDREEYKYSIACKPCALSVIKTQFVCLVMTFITSFVYFRIFGTDINPNDRRSNIKPPLVKNSQVHTRSAGKRK